MATGDHLYWIGWAYECMEPPIRAVNMQFAEANASLTPYLVGNGVDSYFEIIYGDQWIWRLNLWKNNMRIQEDSIVIGETEFIIYRANRLWMSQLWAEFLLGNLPSDEQYPCQCMNFGGAAVVIPNIWV